MTEPSFTPIAPLGESHDRNSFDCGVSALNLYLRNYALQNQKKGIVRNYVTTRVGCNDVVAYYSLVYSSISQALLPPQMLKGMGKYDIPVMLLARLAIDKREQRQGLGKAILKDAVLRTKQAAMIAGIKLLLVSAKDHDAADFYRKHGFQPVVDDALKLFLPISLASI